MAPERRIESPRSGGVGATMVRPPIFGFVDYRQYLRQVYQGSKAVDRRFSCRYVASRVGFRSASFFSQVLNGSCELTPSMALRFAAFLKLDERETDYFEGLVLYARATSVEERARHRGKLASLRVEPSPASARESLDLVLDEEGASLVAREISEFRERVSRIAQAHPGGSDAWRLDVRFAPPEGATPKATRASKGSRPARS